MNKAARLCLLLTGLLFTSALSAQPISDKFGKVEEEYVKMKVFEQDTSASAAILFSKGRVNYLRTGDDLRLVHTYHQRIKILRSSGEKYADVSIPYLAHARYESIGEIKGMTHYVDDNGKVIRQKMDKSAIVDEDIDGRYHYKKFSLPNVKEGAIIEYTYKIISKSWFNTRNWYFQTNIPTAYSKYVTQLPSDFDFRHLTLGEQYPVNRDLGNSTLSGTDLKETVTTYTAENVPALSEEPHVTSMKNYYFRLELQLRGIHIPGMMSQNYIKDWNQLSKQIMEDEDFVDMMKTNSTLKAELEKIIAEAGDDPHTQVAHIYHWVQQNIEWDERRGIYPNKTLGELLKEKKGNAASINVLLVNMLKKAGFQATPMLVCTRANGMPQSIFPTLRQFNHTIAYVVIGEDGIPLDAMYNLTPYNMLPVQDLNHQGMVVSEGGGKWVSIAPRHKHKEEIHNIFMLGEDGTMKGNIKTLNHGYAAYGSRASLLKADDKDNHIRKSMTDGFVDAELITQGVEHDKSIGKPLITTCELETSDYVNVSGDFIYLQPMLNHAFKENPFKLENRAYPVDFAYPRQYRYVISLEIPAGYVVDEAPKSAKIVLPNKGGEFVFHFASMGTAIQLLSDVKINQTVFNSEAYPSIRQFYDLIVAKHAEQLVLKKQDDSAGEKE